MNLLAVSILILLLVLPLWALLRRNFTSGLCYAVFLSVSMSTFLRIPLPGGLPQLTIHRVILVLLFFFSIRSRQPIHNYQLKSFIRLFCLWFLANFLSLVFTSVDPVLSVKRFLDFVCEVFVFYWILSRNVLTPEDSLRVLVAAWRGMVLVAVLAVIERYTRLNPVEFLTQEAYSRDVTSTYQHRILLGTGMAVAFPLAIGFLVSPQRIPLPKAFWIKLSLPLFLAVSYFAQSRGPWLAAAIASGVLTISGGPRLRKYFITLGCATCLVLVLRPGVFETLFNKAEQSTDAKSFKGGTLLYRLELWRVAWAQITESPLRLLFGYGPGCGSQTEIEWNLSYRNQEYGITSWDNQFAYDLYQGGLFGFASSVLLYGAVVRSLYRNWRSEGARDPFLLCLLASALAFVFMMTNVMIFVKPLNFLFWTVVVSASVLGRATELNPAALEAAPRLSPPLSSESLDPACTPA